MGQALTFLILPMFEKLPAPIVIEQHRPAFLPYKYLFIHHPVVYQGDNEPVRHAGAQLFHEIEGK